MEPQFRFCTRSDGVRLAYLTVGDGPPLIRVPGWISNLENDWKDRDVRAFYETLAQHHTLVTYDKHGTGLSDRNRHDITLESDLRDLEAVLDHLGIDQVALLGVSQAGPVCAAYAAKHPDRVSHLILYGSYARGPAIAPPEVRESIISLIRAHWGMGSKALADVFMRGADGQATENFAKFQRAAADAEMAAQLFDLCYQIDVTDQLASIQAPTLIMHRDKDKAIPASLGREMAGLIPGARFLPLEGKIHLVHLGDPEPVLRATAEFLGDAAPASQASAGDMYTILFTDMASSTTLAQQLGDAGAQEVRRAHNDIVRAALSENSGNEIKHTGDGIMASFGTTSTALQAAIAIQRGVAHHNAEGSGPALLQVYVGLNAGEPISEDDDLFGTSINLAARICDRAEAGQILASNVVRELAAGKQFLFADLGETELRGFEDPIKLWELRWEENA